MSINIVMLLERNIVMLVHVSIDTLERITIDILPALNMLVFAIYYKFKNVLITCSAVLRHCAWTEKIVSLIITPHAVRVMLFLYSCIFMMARRKHELSKIPSKIRRAIKLAAVRCVDATQIAARRDALTPTCWTSAGRINQRERPPEYPLPQTLGKVSRAAPKEIPHEGGLFLTHFRRRLWRRAHPVCHRRAGVRC